MDLETVKMIQLLFPEGIPESWRQNSDFYQYLARLGGYEVDRLSKEPDCLMDEKNCVQHNIQDLVFSHYKIFIRIAENSRVVFNEFNQTQDELECLLEKIPHFTFKCKSFCDKSKDIQAVRKQNALTVSKSSEIAELLELPQLMESCLRSTHYIEALELSEYARQLGAKYRNIPIIENIVNTINNSWSVMINQIVDSLREDLPLPRCLQLIGLLRSMKAFTESELRLKFIQARDSWFQNLLESIPSQDATSHLTRVVELSRIHLFNIITQYKALFNDDILTLDADALFNGPAIFHQWLEQRVSQLLSIFDEDLPQVTSIDSMLGQCTYFGLSFGRIGADFSSRMSDVFMKTIRSKFERGILEATKNFETDLESFPLVHCSLKTEVRIDQIISFENPPERLVECYPLAEYCNRLILTFNELRSNAPLALAQCFTNVLRKSLHTVAKIVTFSYENRRKNPTLNIDSDLVTFAESFNEVLIPYVQLCICAMFPPQQMAAYLGISVSQLQKDGVLNLDQEYIKKPLEFLMSEKTAAIDAYLNEVMVSEDPSKVDVSDENATCPQEFLKKMDEFQNCISVSGMDDSIDNF